MNETTWPERIREMISAILNRNLYDVLPGNPEKVFNVFEGTIK